MCLLLCEQTHWACSQGWQTARRNTQQVQRLSPPSHTKPHHFGLIATEWLHPPFCSLEESPFLLHIYCVAPADGWTLGVLVTQIRKGTLALPIRGEGWVGFHVCFHSLGAYENNSWVCFPEVWRPWRSLSRRVASAAAGGSQFVSDSQVLSVRESRIPARNKEVSSAPMLLWQCIADPLMPTARPCFPGHLERNVGLNVYDA